MGFFSSRKAEPTPLPASQEPSVKVIRSRFYGKSKASAQDSTASTAPPPAQSTTLPSPAHRPHAPGTNQSLLPAAGRPVSADALTMSLAQRLNELATANADGLLDDEAYRLLRQNLFEKLAGGTDSPTEAPVVPISAGAASRGSNGQQRSDPHHHVVRPPSVTSQRSIGTAVSSLFRRATGRSVASPTTSTSGSIFSLQQQMSPTTDSVSVYSRPSFSSGAPRSVGIPSSLSRRPSDDSLMSSSQAGSASGSVTADLRGIASRHPTFGNGSVHYASSISSRATTRSAKPPSSFHLRHATRMLSSRTHEEDDDEDHPKSAAELRTEIENVESEGRKLLNAFNGLELAALTKPRSGGTGALSAPPDGHPNSRRLSIYPESTSAAALSSAYTLIPERSGSMRSKNGHVPLVKQPVNLKRKPSMVGSIAGSFKSSASDLRSGFLSSAPPPLHSTRSSPNLLVSAPPTPVPVPPLPTSTSAPSVKKRPSILRQKQPTFPSAAMPLPLPLSLPRGPHTAPPLPRPSPLATRTANGTDPTLHAVEAELTDIRRRKADVSARYERRLEFLRAKLKSAEIRERLSKK